jgi:hypothetical protein
VDSAIFRQAFQKRADASLIKMTTITDRYVPGNEVSQNQNHNGFPAVGTTPAPTGCTASGQPATVASTIARLD